MKLARLFSLLLGLTACQADCTLIGCFNGLEIEVANPPAGPLTVQALASGGPSSSLYTSTCPGTVGCVNTVHFTDFVPRQVRVTVTTVEGTREFTVSPVYRTIYPNGKDCGSPCQFAHEVVSW